MHNLQFIIWMLFYPISYQLAEYLSFLRVGKVEYSIEIKGIASISYFLTYIIIAINLWE